MTALQIDISNIIVTNQWLLRVTREAHKFPNLQVTTHMHGT